VRDLRHELAHGVVRARGAARRRGHDDAGAVPVTVVRLYRAADCGLCERAFEAALAVRGELAFELEVVDIDGDPELEARYRVLIPVVEIDGEQAFTYFVDADELRSRIATRV
jgi:glutaredoxin